MKKIFLTLTMAALTAGSLFAQAPAPADLKKAVDNVKAKLESSDKDIQDAKKGGISKTWESRGKVYLDAARVNTKNVNQNMYAAKCDQSPFYNMELMLGQPQSKRQEQVGGEDFEVWVYPTMEVYVQNNQVVVWKETYVADPNALDKAAEPRRSCD